MRIRIQAFTVIVQNILSAIDLKQVFNYVISEMKVCSLVIMLVVTIGWDNDNSSFSAKNKKIF